ncbi:MAG: YdeI/OmpD-associated family protein [Ferruginibacter sp.]
MINFSTTILKFDQQGEKTGWTYITIPTEMAEKLQPGNKKSFRVKGKLDGHPISGIALIPMGGGDFIMALNADIRKAIGKKKGATIKVQLAVDKPYQLNATFMECMADEPAAVAYFKSLTGSHQNYFSKWIEAAKTEPTKIRRIAEAVSALARRMGYPEMIRARKAEKDILR